MIEIRDWTSVLGNLYAKAVTMLETIEKMLVLQDRDLKVMALREELQVIPAERSTLESKASALLARLDQAKLKGKQIESDRKKLELEAESNQQKIEKYSLQQFQTKKNEEYKALGNEIENCKKVIRGLEDQQIELMEQAEIAAKSVAAVQVEVQDIRKTLETRLVELKSREDKLKAELAAAEEERSKRAEQLSEADRSKYDRLARNKGGKVVVGITHGVCGGCHMGLSRSIVLQCRGEKEIIHCPNCGRILFYTPDMDLAVAE